MSKFTVLNPSLDFQLHYHSGVASTGVAIELSRDTVPCIFALALPEGTNGALKHSETDGCRLFHTGNHREDLSAAQDDAGEAGGAGADSAA